MLKRLSLGVVLVAALSSVVGCRSVRYREIESGSYDLDPLNAPPNVGNVTLELDLQTNKAVLSDGSDTVTLDVVREPDREKWHGDCGTMSGHSMLELVKLRPSTFMLLGKSWTFDTIHVDCGGGGVRMLDASYADGRWIFRRRAPGP